jgi:nicotinamide-nucleotide amidase
MDGAILSIGDELVLGQTADTNAAWLSAALAERGILVTERRTVPDDRDRIAAAFAELVRGRVVVVATGGLGPTADDLTRAALGDVTAPGAPLVTDEDAVAALRRWFRGRTMPAGNLAQAQRPAPMRALANPVGTAPGLAGVVGACAVFALPGPPAEMERMFLDHVAPALPLGDGAAIVAESVHLYGLGESHAAERLGALMDRDREVRVGTTVSGGIVTARVLARGGADAARQQAAAAAEEIERRWQPWSFGRGSATLAGAAGAMLEARGAALVTAESCTGGWLGRTIVDVPGASRWYRGGWIVYANELKERLLGVDAAIIARDGAVSEAVARAMAAGALERGGGDVALAITGVAGPGAEGTKPVGLVYVALAQRGGTASTTECRRFRLRGDRAAVRDRAAKSALQMLRLHLLGAGSAEPMIGETVAEPERAAQGGEAARGGR